MRDIIYDGVSIKIYQSDEADKVIIKFTDSITAFYTIKKAEIHNKGIYCNGISSIISELIQREGIPTYHIKKIGPREQLCYKVDVIPLKIIVRNIVAGTLSERLGLERGIKLKQPIFELWYKNEALSDPFINDCHALALGIVTKAELAEIYELSARINKCLTENFNKIGINLVNFKVEFGRFSDGSLILSDDISPDTARFWDIESNSCLDKDRYRRDDGNVGAAYSEVYDRLKTLIKEKDV